MRLGAFEAGGTKFVCGIADKEGNVLERVSFPTETPEITLQKVYNFFKNKRVEAIGVGSFGPIDPNQSSEIYGYITKTPKKYWSDFNLIGELQKKLNVSMVFDTDVNSAALGEATWGAAKGLKNCLYLTIGTGIGGGVMKQFQLFPLIRKNVKEMLNNYVQTKEILENIDKYIVSPALGDNAGLLGCIALVLKLK